MTLTQYYVLPNGTEWKIRHKEKEYEYQTRSEAIQAAIDAAHESGALGYDSQVLVQGSDGNWKTEWTYRGLPYVPRR